jgi:hypothetical protein
MNVLKQIAELYNYKSFHQEIQKSVPSRKPRRIINQPILSDAEIIDEIVGDICRRALKNIYYQRVKWNDEYLTEIDFTYSVDEYDRKMVPIDKRLFKLPKHIREEGEYDFDTYMFSSLNESNTSNMPVYPLRRCEFVFDFNKKYR